jgi:anti-sigma regulatory factor (Ser/Thr protein kinase)
MQHLAQRPFPAALHSVREACEFVTKALSSWGGCARLDEIRLCVSELAANAIVHGSPDGQDYDVHLIGHPCCVRATGCASTAACLVPRS